MSTRKRSTEYWIQIQRSGGWWDDAYEVFQGPKNLRVKRGLTELAALRKVFPHSEYRLAKKTISVTTTVVNGAET